VDVTIEEQIAELGRMNVPQLRKKYAEVFGEESRSTNRQFLFRRISWRIQALAEGGLSERARRRALEITNDADLRIRAPKRRRTDPDAYLQVTTKPNAEDVDSALLANIRIDEDSPVEVDPFVAVF
jgi:hypothetical protein